MAGVATMLPEWLPVDSLSLSTHAIHDIEAFAALLALLAIYDIAFAIHYPGRWFNCHAFANAITVIFSLRGLFQWIRSPLSVCGPQGQEAPDPLGENWLDYDVLFHPNSDWGVLMILAVHTYHCIAFNLSAQDVFHHFMFVPTIGVYGGFAVKWGPIRNVISFFISGFPGGIDYLMLVLLKNKLVDRLTCNKRLSSKLNVWLRGPGCGVLVPASIYASWTEGKMAEDQVIQSLILAMFAAYNGLYYMEMSVMNYQMHLTRTVLEAKYSEQTRQMVDYWREKEKASVRRPVRGMRHPTTPEPVRRVLNELIHGSLSSTSPPKKDM